MQRIIRSRGPWLRAGFIRRWTVYSPRRPRSCIPYSANGHTLKFSRSGSGDYYIDNISLKVTEVYDYNDFVCLLPAGATEGTRLAPAEPVVSVTNTIEGTLLVAGTDYEVVYSNNPYTRRLFLEAGYEVRNSPLYNRSEYSGTEVRTRIREGKEWEHLVPDAVVKVIKEVDGVNRITEIGESDEYRW